MNNSLEKEIYKYIPHRGKMALLDKVEITGEDKIEVLVNISKDSLLCTEKGVPTFCSVEYMAQTVAAYSTAFLSDGSNNPKIGFMVSIRNFKCVQEYFEIGTQLQIKIEPVLVVENSGTFLCQVESKGETLSSARITAYVPESGELEKFRHG